MKIRELIEMKRQARAWRTDLRLTAPYTWGLVGRPARPLAAVTS